MTLDEIVNKRSWWIPPVANFFLNLGRAICGYRNACANKEVLQQYKDKKIIFASIHRTWDDSVALFDIISREVSPIHAIMRDTLFDFGAINFQPFLKKLGAIPVKRAKDHDESRKAYNQRSISYAASLVANGSHLMFYPQGTRRKDEVGDVPVSNFYTLAHLHGNDPDAVIIPVFVSYNGWGYLSPATVVHFGDPYVPDGKKFVPEDLHKDWISQMNNFFEMEKAKKLPLQK